MWNDKSLINLLYFSNYSMALAEHTNFILRHPLVIVETFKSKSLVVSRHYPAQPFCLVLVLAFGLGNFLVACICAWHHFLGVRLYSNYTIGRCNWKEYCAWFCQAIWLNLFLLLLSCIVNLISESASQGESCCIIVRDQDLSWGSTAALNCFLPQKCVSRMTKGRSRKRYQSSRKSTNESDHSQTRQGEEIATPPSWSTSPRNGRPEELSDMNPSNPLQTETETKIGND